MNEIKEWNKKNITSIMLSYFLLFLNNIKYTFKEEKSLKIIEEIRITLLGFIFCMMHVNANEKKTKKILWKYWVF